MYSKSVEIIIVVATIASSLVALYLSGKSSGKNEQKLKTVQNDLAISRHAATIERAMNQAQANRPANLNELTNKLNQGKF